MIKINLPKVIFLMGPTASGKTTLAIELRKNLPVELISVDSALVYRGMDIGTAKPNTEELSIAPHRLLNIINPTQTYSVANFCQDALTEIDKIIASNRIPLLVGGTMFYYKALLEGLSPLPPGNQQIRSKIKQQATEQGWFALYKKLEKIDPITAYRIHYNDSQRISRALEIFLVSGKTLTELKKVPGRKLPYQVYQFVVAPANREVLYARIRQRFYRMLASGFETEVQKLFASGCLNAQMPSIRCVGYRQMWSWLEGSISYDEMIYQSIYATRQLAKRQITWLRSWKGIYWLDSEKLKQAPDKILQIIDTVTD